MLMLMLFMHNNRYLPLTGLVALLQRTIQLQRAITQSVTKWGLVKC